MNQCWWRDEAQALVLTCVRVGPRTQKLAGSVGGGVGTDRIRDHDSARISITEKLWLMQPVRAQ